MSPSETPAFDWIPIVYVLYAASSVALTIWLARTLGQNGRIFLEKVFADDPGFGDAVNRLLVVGFYLVNLGWAFLHLAARGYSDGAPVGVRAAIELLSDKMGVLLLALGAMHFANLLVFHRIRRGAAGVLAPPVLPQAVLAPGEAFHGSLVEGAAR